MLVDTQKLVAPQQFRVNLVIFVREPLVSMIKNADFNMKLLRSNQLLYKNHILVKLLVW